MTSKERMVTERDPQFRAWETALMGFSVAVLPVSVVLSFDLGIAWAFVAALLALGIAAVTHSDLRSGSPIPADMCWLIVLVTPVAALQAFPAPYGMGIPAWPLLPLAIAWPAAASRLWHSRADAPAWWRNADFLTSMSWGLISLAVGMALTVFLGMRGLSVAGVFGFLVFMLMWAPTLKSGGPSWLERLIAGTAWVSKAPNKEGEAS